MILDGGGGKFFPRALTPGMAPRDPLGPFAMRTRIYLKLRGARFRPARTRSYKIGRPGGEGGGGGERRERLLDPN